MKNHTMQKVARCLGLALLSIGVTSAAVAKSWDQAIADVEAAAQAYRDFAIDRGAPPFIGNAVNEIGIQQHECAIVGRLLGFGDYIRHLEVFDNPQLREGLSEDELLDLMVHAQFLDNWAYTAQRIVNAPDQDRQQIWNLNCVGQQDIPANLTIGIANRSASFTVEGTDLRVLGDIGEGFYAQLESVLLSHQQVDRIILGGGGDNVREAMYAGHLIRDWGLSTTLSDNCYSACALVFLGGVQRTIWSPYPQLALHRISTPDGFELSHNDEVYDLIEYYVSDMGANPDFIMRHILATPPNEFSYPDLEDLCRSATVTWVQRLCTSPEY